MAYYFDRFETRTPPEPLPHSPARELLYQYLAVLSLCLGAWYLWWRWTESLNTRRCGSRSPSVLAETLAFFGLILFTVNLWRVKDYPILPPPASIRDCVDDPSSARPARRGGRVLHNLQRGRGDRAAGRPRREGHALPA
jgi:cellulose synthase (UDP-forming)